MRTKVWADNLATYGHFRGPGSVPAGEPSGPIDLATGHAVLTAFQQFEDQYDDSIPLGALIGQGRSAQLPMETRLLVFLSLLKRAEPAEQHSLALRIAFDQIPEITDLKPGVVAYMAEGMLSALESAARARRLREAEPLYQRRLREGVNALANAARAVVPRRSHQSQGTRPAT